MGSKKKIPEHLRSEPAERAPGMAGRRRVGQPLRESESKYRRLFESIQDVFYRTDAQGIVTEISPSVQRYGYTPDELVGTSVLEVYEDPQERSELLKALQEHGEVADYEIHLRVKDGRTVVASASTRLLVGPDGTPIGVEGFLRDMTRRKQAEEALRKAHDELETRVAQRTAELREANDSLRREIRARNGAEEALRQQSEFLRNTVDSLSHPFYVIDAKDYTIKLANAAAHFGRLPAGATCYALTHGFSEPCGGREHVCPLEEVKSTKAPVIVEHVHYDKDGRARLNEVRCHPILDSEGDVREVTEYALDITERKRAEEELERHRRHLAELVEERTAEVTALNKELEAFVHSVSHDLRAPLRSINGFSHALLEDYADKLDAPARDSLYRVHNASQRMGRLIDDLLALSRVTQSELRLETVDLSALAKTVAAELQEREPERRVTFRTEEGLTVSGDASLLRVALENLLDNAWKFTRENASARIEFGATQSGGKLTYLVRDNGIGFDMASVDRLFSPFQRLHPESEFPGTGIGLATVQRIIYRHGGHVWAEGSAGQGATFYFTLRGQAEPGSPMPTVL